jgi:hypothetical protein
MLETFGHVERRHAGAGVIEVSLQIPDDPHGREHERRLAGWMRAAATGELRSRLRNPGRGRAHSRST